MGRVAHIDLTDPELHESKGVAAAGANEVYVADGLNSGSHLVPGVNTAWSLIGTAIPVSAETLTVSFGTAYATVKVEFNGLRTDTDDDTLAFQLAHSSGVNIADQVADYDYLYHLQGAAGWTQDAGDDQWELTGPTTDNPGLLSNSSCSGEFEWAGQQETQLGVTVTSKCMYRVFGSGAMFSKEAQGSIGTGASTWNGSPDTVIFRLNSGSLFIPTGTINIYGLSN